MRRSLILVTMLAATIALGQEPKKGDKKSEEEQEKAAMKMLEQLKAAGEKQPGSQPASQPAGGLRPRVTLETSLGNIVLELDGDKAPISTKNFLDYVDAGFYNGTIFHRVVKDFMIQGGGFTPEMEQKTQGVHDPIRNEWQNGLKNARGTISMARTQAPDSATTQFFINLVDNVAGSSHDLDTPRGGAAYAVFGKVAEGMDVVDKIRDTKLTTHPKYNTPEGAVTPETPVIVKAAKVTTPCDRDALAKAVSKTMGPSVEEFVKKLEQETGKKVEKTPSGLMYVILTAGTGTQPKTTDTVEVHYVGTFLDGREFDSSVSRGQPATFPLNRVIKGWTEGVSMMKVGEKRKLICPPDLAYGPGGRPGIPPNSTLVFDVELLSIKPQ